MTSVFQTYEWGFTRVPYTQDEKHIVVQRPTNWNSLLKKPDVKLRLIDEGRSQDVDTFYQLTQQHREQYRSKTGKVLPLRYFNRSEMLWQCGPDYTGTYLDFPDYYIQYKKPPGYPITYKRTLPVPLLPQRSLAGVFLPGSDNAYNR